MDALARGVDISARPLLSDADMPDIVWRLALAALAVHGNAFGADYVVTSTRDAHDAAPADGVCDDGTGECTLRAAPMSSRSEPLRPEP
jgi:hypothetical protein